MNKKLFTLAAGLLLGSAFTVNAQTEQLANKTKASDLSGWYYIAVGEEETPADRLYLGGEEITTGTAKKTVYTSTLIKGAGNVKNNDAYLWKITPVTDNGVITGYKLTNKETENDLTFKSSGAIANDKDDAVTRLLWAAFGPDAEDNNVIKYSADGGVLTTKYVDGSTNDVNLKESSESVSTAAGATTKWAIYTQDITEYNAEMLNLIMGDGFSLGFPKADPQPTDNLLEKKLVAVEVIDDDWSDDKDEMQGIYFATSLAKDALDEDGHFRSEALFKASTFIAVDPETNFGLAGNSRASGYGFGLKTVSGKNLVAKANADVKGAIAYANAQFTVKEEDSANKPEEFTISAKPHVMTDATKDKEVWADKDVVITAVTSAGKTYVMTAEKNVEKCTVYTTNIVKASELLEKDAPAVFNIQFLSGKANIADENGSEYGKYLGINNGELLAEGSAYLNLNAPQNQWVITEYDGESGVITFTNREIDEKEINVVLRKTDSKNVYEIVAGAQNIDWGLTKDGVYDEAGQTAAMTGMTIKLVPATVKENAGYADYTAAELMDVATFKFTVSGGLMAKNIYVKAPATVAADEELEVSQNDYEAAQWDLIKNAAVKDSIYGSSDYAYIVKDEKTASKSFDDKAITTYQIRLHGTNFYLTYNDGETKYELADEATNFVIKQNPNGSAYLVVADNSVYSEVINADTEGMVLDEDGDLAQESIYALDNSIMTIELGKVTASLAAVSRHASFQSVNGGFIGVGTNNEAIIAATKDEAKELTFWLDTTDVKEATPSFYISQGIKVATKANADEVRNYLWNPADSARYYDEGTASYKNDKQYYMGNTVGNDLKAMFRQATWVNADSLNTVVAGKEVGLNASNGLNAYKFQIVLADEATEGEYVIRSVKDGAYLKNINGKVALGNAQNALVVTLGEGDATANEAIAAEAGVQVVGSKGAVTVQGAAGKVITVANILGQTIANQVAASDNVTIAVPAGIVVVAVEGEATKVVVK
ncbi:hypothetical protein JQM84_09730 [Parabacteroides distasonis]|nr:hypothetical protein [Parabacteroides distasonis]